MSKIEKKASEMGLSIPQAPSPVAAYVPGVLTGDVIYTAGQIPLVGGELKYKGKLGAEMSIEEGYEAAKACALNCLGVVKGLVGDLDKVEQIIKVVVFVNSAPGFNMQPKVANGASELFAELFGEKGAHARSAVGVNELPLDSTCEVELIVKVKV